MPVADVIRRNQRPLTLERLGAVAIAAGYAAEGTPTTSEIQGHTQPFSARELRNVPEGQNTLEWWHVWSETEIRVRDRVLFDGRAYTVQRVEDWPEGGFYHAWAVATTDQI